MDPALVGRQPRCYTAPCRVVREEQLRTRKAAEKTNAPNASSDVLTTNTHLSSFLVPLQGCYVHGTLEIGGGLEGLMTDQPRKQREILARALQIQSVMAAYEENCF